MGEDAQYKVCGCGRRYRCDGAYAKESCAYCLPDPKRTTAQEMARQIKRAKLGYDAPAVVESAP